MLTAANAIKLAGAFALAKYHLPAKTAWCEVPSRKGRKIDLSKQEPLRDVISFSYLFIRRYYYAITRSLFRVWMQFFWSNKLVLGTTVFLVLVW